MESILNYLYKIKNSRLGFTLIELLITMVIIAVLSIIANSTYQSHIKNSRFSSAESDLVAMSLVLSSYYQQQLSYPSTTTTTAQTTTSVVGWNPTQSQYFNYYISSSSSSSYVINIQGVTGSMMQGYAATLDSSNNKTSTTPSGTKSSW